MCEQIRITKLSFQMSTYNELNYRSDFKDKTVMDFGTGSGILAMFSIMAGAKKVYAIEASDAVKYANTIINFHGLENKVNIFLNLDYFM